MKKQRRIQNVSLVSGCFLILCSLLLLVWKQWSMVDAEEKTSAYVQILRLQMPESEPAVWENKSIYAMPARSVDGIDFVGIIEFPEYNRALPVCADWDTKLRYPSCYMGGREEGILKIGATTQRGQFDFYREIRVGDSVSFTDMTGNQYRYEVADIFYRKHADNETLENRESKLTLFLKNPYALEYVVLYCR